MAKGHDVIEKKYSKLFAALKEQKDASENAKQSERVIFGRYRDELKRYNTEMDRFYPYVLDDIRTVSRKHCLVGTAGELSLSAFKWRGPDKRTSHPPEILLVPCLEARDREGVPVFRGLAFCMTPAELSTSQCPESANFRSN